MNMLWKDLSASGRALPAFLAVGIGWSTHWAQMPAIKAQIGASDALFGVLALLGAIGAILAMVAAPFVQRVVGPWSMALSLCVMALGFVLVGLAEGPFLFTFALFLAAGGSGVGDVLANAEVSAREAQTGRSLMNLNHGMFSVSYAVTAVAVGWAREADWAPVAIYAVGGLVVCLMAPLMRFTATPEKTEAKQGAGPEFRSWSLVWIGGFVVLAAFSGEAASEGWSALQIERTLGGRPEQGAWGPAVLALGMALGRLGGHVFANHLPAMRVMIAASCLAGVGLTLAGIALRIDVAYLGFFLAGLGVSVVGPLALGLVGQLVPEHLRLKAIAQAAAMGYGAFFLGPVLMGFLAEYFGLPIAFRIVGGLMFLVAIALLPLWAARMRALTN